MKNNVVVAVLTDARRVTKTRPIYQYDYGMTLKIEGVELPEAYEMHFANRLDGETITQIGSADGVTIPDNMLASGASIYIWLYLHTGIDDGETVYHIVIPVQKRPAIGDEKPIPAQVDAISQAIAALNDGVERVEAVADGINETVAEALQEAKASGEFDGPPGQPGKEGISPTVSVEEIDSGHRVTITDAEGDHAFDVLDGQGGGTSDYDSLNNKPQINSVPLSGNKSLADLGIAAAEDIPDVPVQDVQVNGTSILSNGVANIPIGYGLAYNSSLSANRADTYSVKAGTSNSTLLTPARQHISAFYGLAKAAGDTTQSASSNPVGTYTDEAKAAIQAMLGGSVSVGGTTPTITALPGIRYVCGEVSTLDITLPASGIVDVTFMSGSTATVLTITPPTGQTLKWANGFDPTALEADTVYEINIADGLGVAAAWS